MYTKHFLRLKKKILIKLISKDDIDISIYIKSKEKLKQMSTVSVSMELTLRILNKFYYLKYVKEKNNQLYNGLSEYLLQNKKLFERFEDPSFKFYLGANLLLSLEENNIIYQDLINVGTYAEPD